MALTGVDLLLVGLAGVGGGAVNAIAGGGTLITFPTLTAIGLPPVSANVTNTVALSPGYLSGTLAQRRDLRGQARRLERLIPAGVVGGIVGGILLLLTGDALFRELVPFLILAASALLAFQERIRLALLRRLETRPARGRPTPTGVGGADDPDGGRAIATAFGASAYGGYFGAGLGVVLLAVLGIAIDDSLTRLNALKQAISFAVNSATAVFFLFSGRVWWLAALCTGVGAIVGGAIGGRLAHRLDPTLLRRIVVAIGVAIGVVYLVR
jgi:uncharacterized membrane protein YfcA